MSYFATALRGASGWDSRRKFSGQTRVPIESRAQRLAILPKFRGSSEKGWRPINLRWLLVMFRVGTLMIALFQAAYILQIVYFANIPATVREPAVLGIDLGIDLLIAALPCLAFALSFSGWFASHWRGVTLALCMALIGLTASANVMRHESVPMFVETLLLLVGTGALIPWSERWQAGLSVFCLTAFAVDQLLTPTADSYVYLRWLGMITGALGRPERGAPDRSLSSAASPSATRRWRRASGAAPRAKPNCAKSSSRPATRS